MWCPALASSGRLGAVICTVRLKQPGSLEGCSRRRRWCSARLCRPPPCWFDGETEAAWQSRMMSRRRRWCSAGFAGRLGAGFTVRLKQAGMSRRMSRRRRWCSARLCRPPQLAGLTVRLKQAGSLEGCPAGAGGVLPGFPGRLTCWFYGET